MYHRNYEGHEPVKAHKSGVIKDNCEGRVSVEFDEILMIIE